MRIHRVSMTAFGPFRDSETVDFDAFADDGLFLIAGRTGAGKTSILDAVCFALYGTVPRYERGADARYRSDHADPSAEPRVTLEFSAGETRYLIDRTPAYDRPARRGSDRLVSRPSTVALSSEVAGEWVGLSASVPDVARRIQGEIVHLSADQFLQVMLLAQNRFQEFLIAESAERRTLLRKIFRTGRFFDLVEALRTRVRTLRDRVASAQAIIDANTGHLEELTGEPRIDPGTRDLATVLDGLVATEASRVAAARAVEKSALERARDVALELERLRAMRRDQERRAHAQRALSEAAADAERVLGLERQIAAAQRAELAWPALERHRLVSAEAVDATQAVAAASATYSLARDDELEWPEAEAAAARLFQAATSAQTQFGALREAAGLEERITALQAAASAARDSVQRLDAQRAILVAEATAITQVAGDVTRLIEELRPIAASVDTARREVADIAVAHAAATKAGESATRLGALRQHRADLAVAAQAAVDRRHAVYNARLSGYSAGLAADLVAGHPCPVCGSLDHPAPAQGDGKVITDAEVAAVDEEERAALYAVTALDREVAATDKELAELLVRSGGGSVDDLAAAAIAAAVRQTQAETAASRLTQAQDALAGHGARTEVITAEVTTLDASRDGLVARAATAAADVAAAEATVTAARGAATSVAARVAALRSVHDAALDLVARRQAADAANAAAHESADERDGVLERFGFDDAADVARHRLSADEVGERASQVAEHRAKVAGAHLVLADESLVGVSDDIVDTTAAEEAAGQSANAATGATADRGAAEVREQAVRSAAHAAREAWDASRTVSDELVLVQRLFASMNGEPPNDRRMKLEDFVLAAKLEEIVAAANGRLTVMTQGRYLLQHSDSVLSGGRQSGLDIVVLDQHTGAPRPTASLSGGEKFLASLALALGLAETVTAQAGGITLDTLFIDEGFGSLDSDTLEIAMETLDGLRAGGRSVGVISHVTEMHERIPAKIEVEVVDGGWSTIR